MRKLDIRHPVIQFPMLTPRGAPSSKHVENTQVLIEAYKIDVRYNLMRHSLEMRIPGFETESERSENATVQCFKSLVQRHGLSPENSLGHLQFLADSYHPVLDWIKSKPWDGTDRMQQFMDTIELAQSYKSGLAGKLVTRWLSGAVRAVMPDVVGSRPFTPQGVLTFQGPQGIGKTEWFKSLAPQDKEWVCTGRVLDPHNRDSIQQTTSYWIAELGELDATFKKSDVVAMKAFVTQPFDVYRTAYAMREERIPRRTMLGASVNPREFLADETGNRRWWTVAVKSLNWGHTVDMQQLWAQVAVMVEQGEKWWLDHEEIQDLNSSNEDHEIIEPLVAELWETWRVPVLTDVGRYPRVKLAEVWAALPTRSNSPMDRRQAVILAEALRKMGALNDGKYNGVSSYRVELIKPMPAYSGFSGGMAFNPSAYKE